MVTLERCGRQPPACVLRVDLQRLLIVTTIVESVFYLTDTTRVALQIGSLVHQMPIIYEVFYPCSIDIESTMAFAAKQFGSRIANPQTVLNHIGSVPIDLSEDASTHEANTEETSVGLKIFQPEENTLDREQARQLGQHLIRWRAELEAAQANLEQQRRHAYEQQEVDQREIARRHKTLQQRERQVSSLESQLLQLQNDVIDGHAALQEIAEKISQEGFLHVVDEEKIGALEDLRFEISERFDYLIERWEKFRDSRER